MKRITLFIAFIFFTSTIVAQGGQIRFLKYQAGVFDLMPIGDELYFSQENTGKVSKINLKTGKNDNDVELVVKGIDRPTGIAHHKGYLYITEFGIDIIEKNDRILRLDLTDSNAQLETFIDSLTLPNGMLVVGDYLYYTLHIENGPLMRRNLINSDATKSEVVIDSLDYANGLLYHNKELYIVESGYKPKISKLHIDSLHLKPKNVIRKEDFSNVEHISTRPVIIENHIYFSSSYNNSVYKFDMVKPNAKPEYVTSSYYLKKPAGLFFYDQHLYIGHGPGIMKYNLASTLDVNEFSLNELTLYPNPTANILNFKGLKEDTAITVYNSIGQQVAQQKLAFNESLNVANLAKGIYFLKFANINGLVKFVKQ